MASPHTTPDTTAEVNPTPDQLDLTGLTPQETFDKLVKMQCETLAKLSPTERNKTQKAGSSKLAGFVMDLDFEDDFAERFTLAVRDLAPTDREASYERILQKLGDIMENLRQMGEVITQSRIYKSNLQRYKKRKSVTA